MLRSRKIRTERERERERERNNMIKEIRITLIFVLLECKWMILYQLVVEHD